MDPQVCSCSDELEKLRKKVAELEQENGKLKLRRQREDDEEKEVSFRRKMLICSCPTACRFSPPDCPAASTSSLLELNQMLALLEKKPSLSADAPLLEVMAKFELPWTPVWQPTVLAAVARRCPHFELTIADVLKRSEKEEEGDEKGAERAWRKKMLICSCPTACRFSPPDCPAASTSSLLELNRMLALLEKTPALSSDARQLETMAKLETCAALWQPTLLEVAARGCPLFELTVAAQPDLSELLRLRHDVLLLDALGQVTMPKGAVLVMSGVEAEEVPVLDGFDKYVVDGGGTMCDELCRMLTQKAIRRVLLVVPFTASTAHQSTWQSVIDRIPIRTDVWVCQAAPSPRRDITAGHLDEFGRLMKGGFSRVYGKGHGFVLKPVLLTSLNTWRHGDAKHFSRLFWSRIGRRLEELHWPRMFEVLGEQEIAELEAEAARRMQGSQPVETKAEKTENAAEEAEIQKKQKKEKSGTIFGCVKSTLKNMFGARKAEEAELEAEAARRMQGSQPVETKVEEAEIEKKQKKEKSGTIFGCVKSTLKNMFGARK